MKTFTVTVEYITTVQYHIEAENADRAVQIALSGSEDGDTETDFSSGKIVEIEDISHQFEHEEP